MTPRRLLGLSVSIILPIIFLQFIILPSLIHQTRASSAASFDVIINEWSQGVNGAKEWVELLVVNGPVDMRGWDLGDDTAGDLNFANTSFWQNVPTGSLIVIYNDSDRDLQLPPDDVDLSDCRTILGDLNIFYFSGNLPSFTNDNPDDTPHLRDQNDFTVHDFSVDPGISRHPGVGEHVYYVDGTAGGVSVASNWITGMAVSATPNSGNGGNNSAWVDSLCNSGVNAVDLSLDMMGPSTAVPQQTLVYTISLTNTGNITATSVTLTDSLPVGVTYLDDDGTYPITQANSTTLAWDIGTLPGNTFTSFNLTVTLNLGAQGVITNHVSVTTLSTETNFLNNQAVVATTIITGQIDQVVIDAVLYDGYEINHLDEAVLLRNVGTNTVDISGWQLNDGETSMVKIPTNTLIASGEMIWLTKDGLSFHRHFGFLPDFELVDSFTLTVPNLLGTWPQLSDSGDQVILYDKGNNIVDCLIYETGSTADCGPEWQGLAIQPYTVGSNFAEDGQILYRLRDQITGFPIPDSNKAEDWAQSELDVINGRKVRYPGWDLDSFFFAKRITETAVLTLAIAPDNAYQTIVDEINHANDHIQIESLTFENVAIGNALINAANRGVSVTVLLEGGPPGGITDQEKYICGQLEMVGGQCWFMVNDASQSIFDRYSLLHAKFMIFDGIRAVVSSENLSPNSLPDDDKNDGTWGRRGVVLVTNAPPVVLHLETIFNLDFDRTNHVDLFRWIATHLTYGAPSPGFVPITNTGGITYSIHFTNPLVIEDNFTFEIIQSPENSLRDQDGLMGLLNQADAGDTILAEQLSERPFWGPSDSDPIQDPNPRLEAYINAARRGARVRILLDSFFDDPVDPLSNSATCRYIQDIAQNEKIMIDCALGNPTGLGIHNKMILAQIGGRGYIHVGSLNGTESSHKANRELALQVQSDVAYRLLAEMFDWDWPYRAYLPVVFNNFIGPANHLLISEILYDPPGADDDEFVELVNPTNQIINLGNYSIGDAVNRTDFEDVRRFPPGTTIAPQATIVVATSATGFFQEYGFNPDFEIVSTNPLVPDLIDDLSWGDPAALFQLGNKGDEVILRDSNNHLINVVVYGNGSYPAQVACPLVTTANSSLERYPYWRDNKICPAVFREWPFPNPGSLP